MIASVVMMRITVMSKCICDMGDSCVTSCMWSRWPMMIAMTSVSVDVTIVSCTIGVTVYCCARIGSWSMRIWVVTGIMVATMVITRMMTISGIQFCGIVFRRIARMMRIRNLVY